MPTDTTPAAQRRQDEVFRAMGPERRLAMALEMSDAAFQLTQDGIRLRHPAYSAEEVRLTAIRVRIGDELFRAAYPDAPHLPA